MRWHAAIGVVWLSSAAMAEPLTPNDTVARCLSCHRTADDRIDIVGLTALENLPAEWVFLYEDAFDLDGDGVAGTMRFVTGVDGPVPGRYGRALSAGRFEDFAQIAAGAHGITIRDPADMARIRAAFVALSPEPDLPDPARLAQFTQRGCASCHVTRTYEHDGKSYMPLSDFLLHDLGQGPVRTAPLWGCPSCLDAPGHAVPTGMTE